MGHSPQLPPHPSEPHFLDLHVGTHSLHPPHWSSQRYTHDAPHPSPHSDGGRQQSGIRAHTHSSQAHPGHPGFPDPTHPQAGMHFPCTHSFCHSHRQDPQSPPHPSLPHSFPAQSGTQQLPLWHTCPAAQSPQLPPHPSEPHCLPWQFKEQSGVHSLGYVPDGSSGRSPPQSYAPRSEDHPQEPK